MSASPIVWNCPSCGKACSAPPSAAGKSAPCPGCGQRITAPASVAAAPKQVSILYEGHPCLMMVWPYLLLGILTIPVFGVGFLVILQGLLNRWTIRLHVTTEEAVLRRGILTRRLSRVLLKDVRAVTLNQGLVARLFGFADIGLSTSAGSAVEVTLYGVPFALHDTLKALISER